MVKQSYDISLTISQVIVFCAVIVDAHCFPCGVVAEVQALARALLCHQQTSLIGVAGCGSIYGLGGSQAIVVISVGPGSPRLADAGEISSTPPEGPATVGGRVSDGVIADALPVVGGQLVLPGVPIAVGVSCCDCSQSSRGVGVFLLRVQVSSLVIGISDTLVQELVVLTGQLLKRVVLIFNLFPIISNFNDISVIIILILVRALAAFLVGL